MYVLNETYESAAAFVLGYDAACEGGPLMGFREWLVLRIGSGAQSGVASTRSGRCISPGKRSR